MDSTATTAFAGAFRPEPEDHALERVRAEIVRLGLQSHAFDLDTQGFTVLTPEDLDAGDLPTRLREALLDIAEAESGHRPDLDGAGPSGTRTAIGEGQFLAQVLFRDRAFEEALLNEKALALITYLLGENCTLSSLNAMLKSAGRDNLELHTDQVGTPAPFPAYAQVANATWVLSEYSRDHGSILFVPGSHRWARHPNRDEAVDLSLAVPVEARPGSLIVWHGNTWHGALARKTPGLRVSLIGYYCRWYLLPQVLYRQITPAEVLARNPARFSTLMGRRTPYAGPDLDGPHPSLSLAQLSQYS
ncbi:MAG: phytanoyl-CoA dioxygenase family protein [Caulobacterales bacterium]|nr:phytanoyl-CoA dioxygenase family protein [Caulobacterales bacterium]